MTGLSFAASRPLEAYAFQFPDQRVAILNGFQPHREGLALDRHLRWQGYGDARNVFRRPPLETGQLVRAAYGESMAVSESHYWFFLDMGNAPARRGRVAPQVSVSDWKNA